MKEEGLFKIKDLVGFWFLNWNFYKYQNCSTLVLIRNYFNQLLSSKRSTPVLAQLLIKKICFRENARTKLNYSK